LFSRRLDLPCLALFFADFPLPDPNSCQFKEFRTLKIRENANEFAKIQAIKGQSRLEHKDVGLALLRIN
jgi:hypothetical protein